MKRFRQSSIFVAIVAILMVASGAAAPQTPGEPAEAGAKVEGVLLGRFLIRDFRAVEGTKLRLSFALFGEVEAESAERLRSLLEHQTHRLRNQVITAVRTCEQREFQEPGLERFRHRILARVRRTLPHLPIDRLLVGEFEFFHD